MNRLQKKCIIGTVGIVLLIIFVTLLPKQSISLKLPKGVGRPGNIRTVEISNTGVYALDRHHMTLNEILGRLASDFESNPNLIVYIRADKDSGYDLVAQLIGGCQSHGITRYSLRTEPER